MALKQRFERIDKTVHDLKGFDCGKPEMNRFLTKMRDKPRTQCALWVFSAGKDVVPFGYSAGRL